MGLVQFKPHIPLSLARQKHSPRSLVGHLHGDLDRVDALTRAQGVAHSLNSSIQWRQHQAVHPHNVGVAHTAQQVGLTQQLTYIVL